MSNFKLPILTQSENLCGETCGETMTKADRPILNPQKLLMSKWTAFEARAKEKHFLVARVINPEAPKHKIQEVEMEAVISNRRFILNWEELTDTTKWVQGWQE
jgi:tryptophan-rich hypothetical protein